MSHEWSMMNGNIIVDNSASLKDGSGGYHGDTRWTYVHMDGGVILDPNVGFYRNPPPDAKCRWSTNYGEKAPNHFNKKTLAMPSRNLWLWNDEKLATVADSYKKKFWKDLGSLTRPQTFTELYEYFDSATLWYAGAYNLWNMMNMLVTEAHQRWPTVVAGWKQEIDEWVHHLLFEYEGHQYNQKALKQWDGRCDPLVGVRFNETFSMELPFLNIQQLSILRDELINNFYHLTGQVPSVGPAVYPYYPRPFDNFTTSPAKPATTSSETPTSSKPATSSKAIVIVTSDIKKRPTSTSLTPQAEPKKPIEETQLPQQPSPPASLASIPEEADVEVEPQGPVTEAADTTKAVVAKTEVPAIVTEPELSPTDSAIRDRKDSNGSTDAMFFNPSPKRLEVQAAGRHMSVQSAPEEKSEPMLPTVAKGTKDKPHQQRDVSARSSKSSNPRDNTKQGSRRPQYSSPPRNNSGPPYHTTGASPPRNNMPHLPPNMQNNMPTAGNPGMMAGPPGLPPQPPHQHPHVHPNGLNHFGPPPPQVATLGPAMGTAIPFHNQLPMTRPPMGQQNFNHGMPPQSPMGFQGPPPPPFQQPGMHDFQRGFPPNSNNHNRKNSGFNGGHKSHRRNSNVSSGSRKVRDDPIHGAVYSLHGSGPRKNSGASSGRRPSFVNGQCNNAHLQGQDFMQLFNQQFRNCPCPRCDEASRSIYVKGLVQNLHPPRIREALSIYFGYLSPIAVNPKRIRHEALVVFRSDHDAIRAIQDFQNNPDKSLGGLAVCADIWHPVYSRHYFLREDFHHTVTPTEGSHHRASTPNRSQSKAGRESWRNAAPGPNGREQFPFSHQLPVNNQMQFVHMPPAPPQRKLWSPTNPRRGIMEPTFPSKQDQCRSQTQSASPQKSETRLEELRTKEDWRSKPPSEEALEDDGDDEATADSVSTHSSLGSRSIVVCLPSPQKPSPQKAKVHTDVEEKVNDEPTQSEEVTKGEAKPDIATEQVVTSSTSPDQLPTATAIDTAAAAASVSSEAVVEQSSTIENPPKDTLSAEIRPVVPLSNTEAPSVQDTTIEDRPNEASSTRDISNEGPSTADPPNGALPIEAPSTVKSADEKDISQKIPASKIEASEPRTLHTASGKQKQKKNNKRGLSEEKSAPNSTETTKDVAPDASSRGYRKTTTDLSSAVEVVWPPNENDTGTVIRHKQPRATLPPTWTAEPTRAKRSDSALKDGDRFASIIDHLHEARQLEGAHKMIDALFDNALATGQKEIVLGDINVQQPPKKKAKHKKEGKVQSSNASGRSTPAEGHHLQPCGPSPAASQHTTLTGPSSRGPSPAMQDNNDPKASGKPSASSKTCRNKRYRNPRRMRTNFDSSEGQAKSGGSKDKQDQGAAGSVSPSKKHGRTEHRFEFEANTMASAAPGPAEASSGGKKTADIEPTHNNKPTKDGYRANNGGSLRMKKNRSPEKTKMNFGPPQDRDSPSKRGASNMPTIFEPTTNESKNQDQNTSDASEERLSTLTPHSWSSIVEDEDPFTAGERAGTLRSWIKEQAARNPRGEANKKRANDSSPTPSPEKKAAHNHSKSKNKLSATAPTFVSSQPASPAPPRTKLDPSVQPFTTSSPARGAVSAKGGNDDRTSAKDSQTIQPKVTTQNAALAVEKKEVIPSHVKKPSMPGQSTGVDRRFITPADQLQDPMKLTQPGAPVREKKSITITTAGARHGQVNDQNPNHIPISEPHRIQLKDSSEGKKPELAPVPKAAVEPATTAPSSTKDAPTASQSEVFKEKKSKGNKNTNNKKNAAEAAKKPTVAEAASIEGAPSMSNDEFPTLGEAASVGGKKKRASSVKSVSPSSGASPQTAPTPAGTTINARKISPTPHQPNNSSAMAAKSAVTNTKDETTTVTKKTNKEEEDGWRVVSSSKKTPTTRGHSGRGGRGGGSWRGSRYRGGMGASDERKGG